MQTLVLCQRIMIKLEEPSPKRYSSSPEGLFSKIDVAWSLEDKLIIELLCVIAVVPLQRYGTVSGAIREIINENC